MTGTYDLTISSMFEGRPITYKLRVERNITILRGNSATGKTTICEIVRRNVDTGDNTRYKIGIKPLQTTNETTKVGYLTDGMYNANMLKMWKNTIFFVDEEYTFYQSNDFMQKLKESGNYVVLITRNDIKLAQLPIAVSSILTLDKVTETQYETCLRHKALCFYGKQSNRSLGRMLEVYVEDTGTGLDFFSSGIKSLYNKDICKTAYGAPGVKNVISNLQSGAVGVVFIVDQATFGAYIEEVLALIEGEDIFICLPESFEWLLLHSPVFKDDPEVRHALQCPYLAIDSAKYTSWERYFTSLLKRACNRYGLAYNKTVDKLHNGFKTKEMFLIALKYCGLQK